MVNYIDVKPVKIVKQSSSGDFEVTVDDYNALTIIDIEQQQINEGNFFGALASAVLSTTDTLNILIRTPDTSERFHAKAVAYAEGAFQAELFEDPTLTGSGTALAAYNFNRASSNTSNISRIAYNATTSGDGTRLPLVALAGSTGVGRTRIAGAASQHNKLILKQDTEYLLKLTSNASDNQVFLGVSWFEDTPES